MEARDGRQVVVAIGRWKGAGEGPETKEPVVDDVEGLGLVAKVMFAPRLRRGIGVRVLLLSMCGLIGAAVVDVGGLRVARSDQPTVLLTSFADGDNAYGSVRPPTGNRWPCSRPALASHLERWNGWGSARRP